MAASIVTFARRSASRGSPWARSRRDRPQMLPRAPEHRRRPRTPRRSATSRSASSSCPLWTLTMTPTQPTVPRPAAPRQSSAGAALPFRSARPIPEQKNSVRLAEEEELLPAVPTPPGVGEPFARGPRLLVAVGMAQRVGEVEVRARALPSACRARARPRARTASSASPLASAVGDQQDRLRVQRLREHLRQRRPRPAPAPPRSAPARRRACPAKKRKRPSWAASTARSASGSSAERTPYARSMRSSPSSSRPVSHMSSASRASTRAAGVRLASAVEQRDRPLEARAGLLGAAPVRAIRPARSCSSACATGSSCSSSAACSK